MEMGPARAGTTNMTVFPDLFLHTDYMYSVADRLIRREVLYEDSRTKVSVIGCAKLKMAVPFNHYVNPDIASFPSESRSDGPRAFLLDLQVDSIYFGCIKAWVLYLVEENINVLSGLLLRHRVKLTHMVKIRDGSGFGGGRVSMLTLFPFLSELGVEWVASDQRGLPDSRIIDALTLAHGAPKPCGLEMMSTPSGRWSEMEYGIFRVISDGVNPKDRSMFDSPWRRM